MKQSTQNHFNRPRVLLGGFPYLIRKMNIVIFGRLTRQWLKNWLCDLRKNIFLALLYFQKKCKIKKLIMQMRYYTEWKKKEISSTDSLRICMKKAEAHLLHPKKFSLYLQKR